MIARFFVKHKSRPQKLALLRQGIIIEIGGVAWGAGSSWINLNSLISWWSKTSTAEKAPCIFSLYKIKPFTSSTAPPSVWHGDSWMDWEFLSLGSSGFNVMAFGWNYGKPPPPTEVSVLINSHFGTTMTLPVATGTRGWDGTKGGIYSGYCVKMSISTKKLILTKCLLINTSTWGLPYLCYGSKNIYNAL